MSAEANFRYVSDEAFAAQCALLGLSGDFAIAVSGGRDSMALACLAANYARNNGVKAVALTVDHQLRAHSATEAEQTAQWCAALGLEHQILRWEGEKPGSGVQAAARQARYRLLAEAAGAAGVDMVMTAHNADDQAETIMMRLARGAGPRGLTGMASDTLIATGPSTPVRLLRPLLAFSRAQLTATAEHFGQIYIDDPSNEDIAYERVRVRALFGKLYEGGAMSRASLLRTGAHMVRADAKLKALEAAQLRELSGCFYGWGGVSIKLAWSAPDEISEKGGLLRRLVYAVSGGEHMPDEASTIAATVQAISSGSATLGGAIVKKWRDALWFLREPAMLTGRAGVAPLAPAPWINEAPILWDNRFICTRFSPSGAQSTGPLVVKTLGAQDIDALGARISRFSGPREGLKTLPIVFSEKTVIAAPIPGFQATGNDFADKIVVKSLVQERFSGAIIRFS